VVVASYSEKNKMGKKNLATVFGPNILKAQSEDPMKLMAENDLVTRVVEMLIEQSTKMFTKVPLW